MQFTKMHGLGNDFICIDCMESELYNMSELSVKLCDRHLGIGGDGVIYICRSNIADFKMRIFNADGSEAAMCGNGLRCACKYVSEHIQKDTDRIYAETGAGIKTTCIREKGTQSATVSINMGRHEINKSSRIYVKGFDFPSVDVSVGNRHLVLVSNEIGSLNITEVAETIYKMPEHVDEVNIELAEPVSNSVFAMRVFERGCGETMACGTGACAVFAALRNLGLIGDSAEALMPGGSLSLKKTAQNNIIMTGPAATVYEGSVCVEWL